MRKPNSPLFSRVHPEGYRFIAGFGLAGLVSLLLGWGAVGGLLLILALASALFFRDPERYPPRRADVVVAPADGRILAVEESPAPAESGLGDCLKISIFMSILDVHVNRAPVAGAIIGVHYRPGKFFSANLDKASRDNERNLIVMENAAGQRLAFAQIAGLIARRIVCFVAPGDEVGKGERCGLIRFGSRVELFLPPDSVIEAVPGQMVRGGESVIGFLPNDP